MSHVKTLAVVTALALGLVSMDAFAANPGISTAAPVPASSATTYYIAAPGTPQAHKVYYFNRLDLNHDGELTRSELPEDMGYLRAYFIYADWDDNGKISPNEYLMYKHHTSPRFVGVYHVFVYDF